jgi:outer membrane protein insertion porin family
LRSIAIALMFACAWLVAGSAAAQGAPSGEVPVVRSIQVEGNRRIESLAITGAMSIKEGQAFNAASVAQSVRAIFRLGAFKDVQVYSERMLAGDDVMLVVVVEEHPVVSQIVIEGNKKVDKEKIQEVVDIKPFTILDLSRVRRNLEKVRGLYTDKGYYLARVESEVRPNAMGEVDVAFVINEGRKVLVRRVEIIGNEAKPDSAIKPHLTTKEAGILGMLGEKGAYKEGQADDDAEMVAAFYQEFGYLDVKVSPPEVFLSPDRRWVTVRIAVDEGEPYAVGPIALAGDIMGTEEELLELTQTKQGDEFRWSAIQADVQALTDHYTDQGYAFANVIPVPRQDPEGTGEKVMGLTYTIQRGELARLGRILIEGNDRTWDKTIRREIPLVEGQRWEGSVLREARRRMERLGYFEDVNLTTPRGEEPDVLDLHVRVTERSTGTFSVGAGFSQIEKFSFNGQLAKDNFLGLGYSFSAMANVAIGSKNPSGTGRTGQRLSVDASFSDPNFMDSRWSASLRGFYHLLTFPFPEFRRGFSLGFGRWLDQRRDLQVFLEYRFNNMGLRQLNEHETRLYGGQLYRSGTTSSLSANLTWDRRNNRLLPTKGVLVNLGAEFAGGMRLNDKQVLNLLCREFRSARLQANLRLYYPLFTNKLAPQLQVVARWNITGGWILSTDGSIVPISLRYRAGGINSLRGHFPLTLGPSILDTNRADILGTTFERVVGGTWSAVSNWEIEFPLIPPAGLRGVVFLDGGNAFGGLGGSEPPTFKDLRWSVGFGVRWQSPMGPMRFEWGFPLDRRDHERRSAFEFTIGSFF